jgi:hypothetical protein
LSYASFFGPRQESNLHRWIYEVAPVFTTGVKKIFEWQVMSD